MKYHTDEFKDFSSFKKLAEVYCINGPHGTFFDEWIELKIYDDNGEINYLKEFGTLTDDWLKMVNKTNVTKAGGMLFMTRLCRHIKYPALEYSEVLAKGKYQAVQDLILRLPILSVDAKKALSNSKFKAMKEHAFTSGWMTMEQAIAYVHDRWNDETRALKRLGRMYNLPLQYVKSHRDTAEPMVRDGVNMAVLDWLYNNPGLLSNHCNYVTFPLLRDYPIKLRKKRAEESVLRNTLPHYSLAMLIEGGVINFRRVIELQAKDTSVDFIKYLIDRSTPLGNSVLSFIMAQTDDIANIFVDTEIIDFDPDKEGVYIKCIR